MWKKINIYGVHISKKCFESKHFYSWRLSPLKSPSWIFWKSVSPNSKRSGENYDLLYKNSMGKYEDDLEVYVIFLNVMALQFCKEYLSHSVVLSLLPLLCNHDNLTRKLQKKSYLNEEWLFRRRFKVESLPRIIIKEVLPHFLYKPTQSTVNYLPWKNWKFISLAMYIEERGREKAKILLANCYIEKFRLAGIIFKYTKFGF